MMSILTLIDKSLNLINNLINRLYTKTKFKIIDYIKTKIGVEIFKSYILLFVCFGSNFI